MLRAFYSVPRALRMQGPDISGHDTYVMSYIYHRFGPYGNYEHDQPIWNCFRETDSGKGRVSLKSTNLRDSKTDWEEIENVVEYEFK